MQHYKISPILSIFLYVLFLFINCQDGMAQKVRKDKKLQTSLESLIEGFRGQVGIYVYHLKSGKGAAVNADSIFPTASLVKIPILVGVFDKIEKKELGYYQPLMYHDSIQYGGTGLMQFFKDSSKINLRILTSLMISYSDNTASLWNQALAGGGPTINKVMEKLGFEYTRVNSRTPGREKSWEKYGWGQTTPREMATLLVKIRNGQIISQAASEKMYRLMTNIYYDEYALSQVPPYIQSASKQGMVDASRSELVMVNAPHGDYVFFIATKENEDQRWEKDNESWVLMRTISSFLWNYFEPRSEWVPPSSIPEKSPYQ